MNVKGLPFDQFFWPPILISVVAIVIVGIVLKKKELF